MVLDGSSACACASELLVRHSGVVSARLASTSNVRTDGGKMETAGKDRMSQCLSGLLSANTWEKYSAPPKLDANLKGAGSVLRWPAVENSCPPQRNVQTLTVATTKTTN